MSLFDALEAPLVLLSSEIFLLFVKTLFLIVLNVQCQVLPDLVDALVIGAVAEDVL